MRVFTTYSRLQQENEGRRPAGMGGRGYQHSCHSLVKTVRVGGLLQLQAYWHWPGDISYQITLTATLDVSHTKCARLVTDAQRQRPDKRGALTSHHDRDQIVAWRHDHRSFKCSHEHSPRSTPKEFCNCHRPSKPKLFFCCPGANKRCLDPLLDAKHKTANEYFVAW